METGQKIVWGHGLWQGWALCKRVPKSKLKGRYLFLLWAGGGGHEFWSQTRFYVLSLPKACFFVLKVEAQIRVQEELVFIIPQEMMNVEHFFHFVQH